MITTEGTIATTLRARSAAKAPHLITRAILRSESVIGHSRLRLRWTIRCAGRPVLRQVPIRVSKSRIPGKFVRLGECRLRDIRIIGSVLRGSSTVIWTGGRPRQIPGASCSPVRGWPHPDAPWTADPTRIADTPDSAGTADSSYTADITDTTGSAWASDTTDATGSAWASNTTDTTGSAWASDSP